MGIPSWAVPGAKVEPPKVIRGEARPGTLCACGDHAFAVATRGLVVLVSPEDIAVFNRKWSIKLHRGHALVTRVLWPERTSQVLSRLITQAPAGKVVDHISRDTLDNRRSNLRVCEQVENSWNSIGHRHRRSGLPKGVSQKRRRFVARIKAHGVTYRLGAFDTPAEAHAAYAAAAKRLHGEFARAE